MNDRRDQEVGLQDWLLWRSKVTPGNLALKCDSVEWTYEQLHERASNLAGLFVSWGIERGDRVALLLAASETYVAVVHALTRIGAVTVPLNVRQSPSELLWQMRDCRPSLVLCDPQFSNIRQDVEDLKAAFQWRPSTDLKASSREPVTGGTMDEDALQSIVYTSGSTGTPKGVEITLSNLLWNAISFGLGNGASSSDRWLLVMPLFHVGGYAVIFRSVLYGSSIVLQRQFDASDVSNSMDHDGITLVSLVPTMLGDLLQVRRAAFPRGLRRILLGGAPTPPDLLREILERELPVTATYA